MKIAVNTRLLIKDHLGGIGWFSYQTLKRITRDHPQDDFIFIFDRPYNADFIFSKNIRPIVLYPPARHPVLWYIWFEYRISRFLKKEKPDLFLSPDGFLSLHATVPTLPVIHDINFYHLPENLPFFVRKYYLKYFPLFAQKATRIATVSEYSKSDMVKSYHIPSEKIYVVYNGSDEIFQPMSSAEQLRIKKEISSGQEYFVFIGSLSPRKNLSRLLRAFDLFKQKTGLPHKMVIIGDPLFRNCQAQKTHTNMHFKEDVIFPGRIPREKIKGVLASSRALIFVPYFEGFGIPILEAFRCEVPVVCGNRTSLPEVGGDAVLYVDPFSIESIAEGMIEIDKNEELRKDLVEKSSERGKMFTWEKTAALLWKAIEATVYSNSLNH